MRSIYATEYNAAECDARFSCLRHFWLRSDQDIPIIERREGPPPKDHIKPFLEQSARELGVEIIWYGPHSELAERLDELRKVGNGQSDEILSTV